MHGIQRRREGKTLRSGHDAIVRVTSPRHQRAHAVAHPPALSAGSDPVDHARDLETGNIRGAWRRGILPGSLHEIRPVDPCRFDPDEDFPRPGFRDGATFDSQYTRAAG
jgi:hypothetical protein